MSESSRITLGQFLKDANHTAKENLSGQEESRLVAPFAYNPGFPSEPADGTVSTDTEQRIDTEQTPILDSENDLSLASKKALNEYTQDRLQSGKNRFRPKEDAQTARSGHARGDTLDRDHTGVKGFAVSQDEKSAYSDYFIEEFPELISDKGQHSSALVDALRLTNRDESDSTFGKKLVADKDSTVYDPFKKQVHTGFLNTFRSVRSWQRPRR